MTNENRSINTPNPASKKSTPSDFLLQCDVLKTAISSGFEQHDVLLKERIEKKAASIISLLEQFNGDRNRAFYITLFRAFGFDKNGEAMHQIALTLPYTIFMHIGNDLTQIEALLFGQGGLLEDENLPQDEYTLLLKREYNFLKTKYTLSPIKSPLLSFSGIRPANFPTLRLSQLANLIFCKEHLLSALLESENIKELHTTLQCKGSPYWQEHYRFGQKIKTHSAELTSATINLLIINTIIPYMIALSKYSNDSQMEQKAYSFLYAIAPEKNHITQIFTRLGLPLKSSADTQAVIGLYKEYCANERCDDCILKK